MSGDDRMSGDVRDLDALRSWHADWRGLRVAVLGLSMTGFSAADTLAELGADVLVVTEKASEEYARLVPVIGARLVVEPLQEVPAALVEFAPEVIVASPGFAPHHPLIRWAQASGIALWGDVELAWRVRDKVPYSRGEQMNLSGGSGWMVEGSPDALIRHYNELIAASNRLR